MSRSLCPDCNANRGLAEYDNGTYCFGCHKSTVSKSLMKRLDVQTCKKSLQVPEDNNYIFPEEALQWLLKYGAEEINYMDDCFWSDEYQRIVFPSPCGKAAWMRSVTEQPKWLFVGDKDVMFHYPTKSILREIEESEANQKCVCLTEDVVSAIKVSEVMDSIALGGTVLKESTWSYIGMNGYQKVYIFLDGDSAGKKGAEFCRRRLSLLADCVIIRGRKDPKEFSIEELRGILK